MSSTPRIVHRAVTDGSGHFEFPSLQPGRYVVKISKTGFATTIQENLNLTVGRTISLKLTLQVKGATRIDRRQLRPAGRYRHELPPTPRLASRPSRQTPVLGRKFEDFLTLTPGVSIVQGPDGDEININGQRGIFNNISLDGGDYNNGFFGEQSGGQRAAVDITLEAVKEFQVVASGANAEFGRTGGGVVNVITKSGTKRAPRQLVPLPAARGPHRQHLRRHAPHRLPSRAVRRQRRRPHHQGQALLISARQRASTKTCCVPT